MPSNTLLRFPGGKSKAAQIILKYFPSDLPELCSSFFGGGAIEFELASRGTKVYGYDSFHSLVMFWKCVENSCERELLINQIETFYPLKNKEDFRSLQKNLIELDNKKEESTITAALFFILNRCSFSGTTLSGGYSPKSPRFTQNSIEKIRSFDMKNVSIECMDFTDSIPLHKDKFLYCDPPYYLENSNLYGIKGDLHKNFDHVALGKILLTRENWALSYNDCEFIRETYKDCKIIELKWSYGMNKTKKSNEVLIMPTKNWRCL